MENKKRSVQNTSKASHKCPFEGCNATFYRPYRLQDHLAKHEGQKPYLCDVPGCQKSYTNGSHLKRHKITCHGETTSNEQETLCPHKECGIVLANKYSLQKHMKVHDESKFTFACTHCSEKFKKKKHLNQHVALHKKEEIHHCDKCKAGFISLGAYKKHVKRHKTYVCDCEETFYKWTKFLEHRKSCETKEAHQCIICKKTFSTRFNLKVHALVHVEESQKDIYRCMYLNCNRSYFYKKNLQHHIEHFHEKVFDKIKCVEPNCEQEFKSRSYMKRHCLTMHSNKPKVKKPRKPRKDKGTRKTSVAALLSGVELSHKEHLQIINSTNETCEVNTLDNINILDLPIIIVDSPNETVENVNVNVSESKVANIQKISNEFFSDLPEIGQPVVQHCILSSA